METLTQQTLIAFGIFLFGTLIGSFLNVVIYRVPKGESIAFPASKCQSCSTPLRYYHNIPIYSWLFLRGKCGFCKEKISIQYPLVEMFVGILFVLLYMKLGLVWYLPFVAFSFSALFALSVIDVKYMAVPDSINFTALGFALITDTFVENSIYALIAGAGLYLISFITAKIFRKDTLGGADVIVAGTMGALLGLQNFLIAMFLSAVLSLFPSLMQKGKPLPFVPFLSVATFIVYMCPKEIIYSIFTF